MVSDFQDTCLVFQSLSSIRAGWRRRWEESRFQLVAQSKSQEKMWEELQRASSGSRFLTPPQTPSTLRWLRWTLPYLEVHGDRKPDYTGRLLRRLCCRCSISWWSPVGFLCSAGQQDWRKSSGDLHPAEVSAEDQSESLHTGTFSQRQTTQNVTGLSSFAPLMVHFLLYLV